MVTSTVPAPPVNVPPDTVNPPSKVLVLVEARYVPPDIVARPVTVTALPFTLKTPPELLK